MPDTTPDQNPIEIHVKNYRNALKSTHEIAIHSLETSHGLVYSTLHPHARDLTKLDIGAFCYALIRLPECIDNVQKIILGQNEDLFCQANCDINTWQAVTCIGRRRKMYLNTSTQTLSCFIASISDIDDMVTTLTALQIEWNKLHHLLKDNKIENLINETGLKSLQFSLGATWQKRLKNIATHTLGLHLQLLASSWIDYAKTSQAWWKHISKILHTTDFHLSREKLYFVSSNTHSLINLATGSALSQEAKIVDYLKQEKPLLFDVYNKILSGEYPLPKSDFLYYCTKFITLELPKNPIISISPPTYIDITTQIIPVSYLAQGQADPQLKFDSEKLKKSTAYILNIDYPLGFLAYHLLNESLENTSRLLGVYIMGKAAILNGQVGDIQVPRVVYDEHTKNSYLFHNCFNHSLPFTNNQGSILTNQKAASVLGTYLQNKELLDEYSTANISILEMESGPYLSAIAEATYQDRLPQNTIIDLNQAPLDIGIINYASDNPNNINGNLGTQGMMELTGAEPVALATRAILQRIINLETS